MKRLSAYFLRPALAIAIAAGSATLASAAASVASASVGQGPSAAASPGTSSGGGDGYEPFAAINRTPPKLKRPIFCVGARCHKPRSDMSAKVCFYTAAFFRGEHFCTRPGTSSPKLSRRWNDRISSIRVIGSATAKICSSERLDGRCIVISSDRSYLASLDDAVSSFAVR